MPMLALRGVNIFPKQLMTFDIERRPSINALNTAARKDRIIFLAAQKDPMVDIPEEKDLYTVGVICRIKQQITQQGSRMCKVMVEGIGRAKAVSMLFSPKGYMANVMPLEDAAERVGELKKEALVRNVVSLFEEYVEYIGGLSAEQMIGMFQEPTPSFISDYVSQNTALTIEEKQALLEELRPCRRLEMLSRYLNRELEVFQIEKEIDDATHEALDQSQKEYFLREQLKIIQSELGDEGMTDDIDDYRRRINALPVSDEIRQKLLKELSHLTKQPFGSSEASVIRGYLDTCLELPWGKKTQETLDLEKARKILEKEHYGLEKVKERILEYLAVRRLSPEVKGGLICLVGPPGTGKTSVAMSIARATNRKLVRISLGGVHDEADIRGHRRTYIGSMPGRIINGITQAGSSNPLMVLDEIDKLGSDYRGDPSAALLEAFDSEQNYAFRDHFLEIPFDLSEVFFITTANTTETIPPALLDRMEVIELPSYTDEEKLMIAKQHLIPKMRKKHGLSASQLKIRDDAVREIIASYTKESGVRVLEREIASVCRKAASGIAEQRFEKLTVDRASVSQLLGPVKFKPDEQRTTDAVGLVRGLAWTSVGGEVLDVEVAVVEGTGKLELTGNLGDVMKESAHAAVTCIRARADELGIDRDFYKNRDIHVHFPEGAIPKDGPSAGITMTIALISALTGIPARHDVAMTGEITLRGRVLPIGGLREKTMGALRAGVKTVIIPESNSADLEEIDPLVRSRLNFVHASSIDDVIPAALSDMPRPSTQTTAAGKTIIPPAAQHKLENGTLPQ